MSWYDDDSNDVAVLDVRFYGDKKRDHERQIIKQRAQGGRQKDDWPSAVAYSPKEEFTHGKMFARIVIEGMSQRIVELGNFYKGFEHELDHYMRIDRSWKIDAVRICGILDVISRVVEGIIINGEEDEPKTASEAGE